MKPKIKHQAEDSVVAHVFCCYWNDWKGLIREHVKMTLKNGLANPPFAGNIDKEVIAKSLTKIAPTKKKEMVKIV